MQDAHCPLGKWEQDWSVVVANPTRQNIRSAYEMNPERVWIIGEVPGWYLGQYINCAHRYSNSWSEQIRWLQITIDESLITENFLWVGEGCSLVVEAFNVYRTAHHTPSPIHPLNEALLVDKTHFNYQTQWPNVFNKGKLQAILDEYKPPYHVPTIYHNHYNTPTTHQSLPEKEELPLCPLEFS